MDRKGLKTPPKLPTSIQKQYTKEFAVVVVGFAEGPTPKNVPALGELVFRRTPTAQVRPFRHFPMTLLPRCLKSCYTGMLAEILALVFSRPACHPMEILPIQPGRGGTQLLNGCLFGCAKNLR